MYRLALLSMLLAARVLAADAEAAIRATLVEPWLRAVRANDKAELTRFLHPQVRACINDRTREFFEFGDLLRPKGLTPQHRITKLTPLSGPGNLFGLPEDGFAYPVQPAYELTLEAWQGDTQVIQIIRYLAPSGGSWYFVEPCPNEKGLAFFHESLAKGAEQKRQVALLVAQLKEPLLGELKDLLKRHQKIDAVKKYQQATGQDLTLSMMVMEAIEKGNP